ncbi:hypothetical protein Tco_1352042 [Tanacetum coccineum]
MLPTNVVPLGKSADVAALFPNGTTVPSALKDKLPKLSYWEIGTSATALGALYETNTEDLHEITSTLLKYFFRSLMAYILGKSMESVVALHLSPKGGNPNGYPVAHLSVNELPIKLVPMPLNM